MSLDARSPTEDLIDEPFRRRFEAAWLAGEPLSIEDCLPPRDVPAWLPTLEELVQIELEFAWKAWARHRRSTSSDLTIAPPPRPPRVEQYLVRFPQLDQPAIVARLAEQEFAVRTRAGERPERAEYWQRFRLPSQFVETHADVAGAGTRWASSPAEPRGPSPAGDDRASPIGRRLGNYELLAELGRGGMGVVYRARQLAAERIVALKVVRADQLSSLRPDLRTSAVERFHHEALATARLQHPHIVTVFEVGEEQGQQYFSMQFVDGPSLAELLREGPLAPRRAAAYLEPVARAVAAAHEAGILHRDLKPQNILVDTSSDRALVADFGLAKLVEQGSELTRAGDVMGTPPYMSPEQATNAAGVTRQSDVYSLGATLYHMLAARPPFQAASALETLFQVQTQEPVPPSRLNPAIDRDLETICLTCLHKEPARRYGDATLLADDLRRYLDGMPIVARPVGRPERLWRWCRRNPLLAGATAVASLLLVATALATTVGYITTTTALAGKTAALAQSERNYRQARAVVDQFFRIVSEDILLDQPGAEPLRNRLLQLALDHDRQFLTERGNDPELLEEIARTHYRVGLITQAIEPAGSAGLASLQKALAMQRKLAAEEPESTARQEAFGDTLNALGQTYLRQGDEQQALDHLAEARTVRGQVLTATPAGAPPAAQLDAGRKYANTIMNIGLVHKQARRSGEALEAIAEAQTQREKLLAGSQVESAGDTARLVWRDLAMGWFNRANLALAEKQTESAAEATRRAIEIMEPLVTRDSTDLRNRERLAACYHLLGRLGSQNRDLSAALRLYEQSIDTLEKLHRGSPQVHEFEERLAIVYLDLGGLHHRERNVEAAAAALQTACDHFRAITPAPTANENSARRRNYAVALRELARQQIKLKQYEPAAENLQRSQEYLEGCLQQGGEPELKQSLQRDLLETEKVRATLRAN
jgi:tetratricopeptide (TPR) repeat protein/predicted Ser/Thr protein kinase